MSNSSKSTQEKNLVFQERDLLLNLSSCSLFLLNDAITSNTTIISELFKTVKFDIKLKDRTFFLLSEFKLFEESTNEIFYWADSEGFANIKFSKTRRMSNKQSSYDEFSGFNALCYL